MHLWNLGSGLRMHEGMEEHKTASDSKQQQEFEPCSNKI